MKRLTWLLQVPTSKMDLRPFKFYPHEILFEVIWEPWYIPYQGYISYTFKSKIKK